MGWIHSACLQALRNSIPVGLSGNHDCAIAGRERAPNISAQLIDKKCGIRVELTEMPGVKRILLRRAHTVGDVFKQFVSEKSGSAHTILTLNAVVRYQRVV